MATREREKKRGREMALPCGDVLERFAFDLEVAMCSLGGYTDLEDILESVGAWKQVFGKEEFALLVEAHLDENHPHYEKGVDRNTGAWTWRYVSSKKKRSFRRDASLKEQEDEVIDLFSLDLGKDVFPSTVVLEEWVNFLS